MADIILFLGYFRIYNLKSIITFVTICYLIQTAMLNFGLQLVLGGASVWESVMLNLIEIGSNKPIMQHTIYGVVNPTYLYQYLNI